ncbi:unnamed protein product, partial [Mesorhabditis spiculigera]
MDSVRKRRKSLDDRQRRLDFEDNYQEVPKEKKEENGFDHKPVLFYLILLAILAYICQHLHTCLPEPLSPNEDNTQFSEIRAFPILQELSDYGPKPAGSHACEELARERILDELRFLKNHSKNAQLRFEIDTQNPSDCFSLPKHDTDGFSICYRNVSNVIARIGRKVERSGTEKRSEIAILLNCHYDSWPTSSAGSDDLSSCALMLELMRVFVDHPEYLKHDVIMLFNGAEESSLLAAHGFITQHRWRHDIRAFINLEASGSGGRELLFQAGPANEWLLNSYLEAAVHPHCSVLGQEIFQSGAYPGDTDYRIFRDYGRIPGLDLAFVQNGYWWHTEFDEAKRITPGSLQRAGENVLSTLKHLLASPYLTSPAEFADEKSVFFDFLGLFVVVYPLDLANGLNLALIFLVAARLFLKLVDQRQTHSHALMDGLVWNLLYFLFTALFCYKLAYLKATLFGQMLWYSNHLLVIPFYALPLILFSLLYAIYLSGKFNKRQEEFAEAFETISDLFVAAILLFLTYKNIASGYLFFFQLLPSLSFLTATFGPNGKPLSRVLLSIPAICLSLYTAALLLSIFIPIMGRTSRDPEPFVLIFVSFGVLPAVRAMFSLALRSKPETLKRVALYLGLLIGAWLTVIALFNTGPYLFVDEYPTTKRTQLYHVNRELYNKSGALLENRSLLYAISHDDRGALDIPFVKRDERFTPIHCVYAEAPYCEIPFYFPTRGRIGEKHIAYKNTEPYPMPEERSHLDVLAKKAEGNALRYKLRFRGSPQMSIYATAVDEYTIANCSMKGHEPDPEMKNVFLYYTCSGEGCGDWEVEFDLQRPGTSAVASDKALLIGVTSHYLHGPNMESDTLRQILNEISEKRVNDTRWAITSSAWNNDWVARLVNKEVAGSQMSTGTTNVGPPGQTLGPKEQALFRKISKCYDNRQHKQGLRLVRNILEQHPDHGETLSMKGLLLAANGAKFDEAFEAARLGLKCNVQSALCWHAYGILLRTDHQFEPALKALKMAMAKDKNNQMLARDYSLLQMQIRDFHGFKETRLRLAQEHPHETHWFGYAIGCHLTEDYETAFKVMEECVKNRLNKERSPKYKVQEENFISEMILYQCQILQDAQNHHQLIGHLEENAALIKDPVRYHEILADTMLQVRDMEGSARHLKALIARNPNNGMYYQLLEQTQGLTPGTDNDKLVEFYAEFTKQHPKAFGPRVEPLRFLEGDGLKKLVFEIIVENLRKGLPSLFKFIEALYEKPEKVAVLDELFEELLSKMDSQNDDSFCFSDEPDTRELPNTKLWFYFLLAQHYDKRGKHQLALDFVDRCIRHNPTLIDVYLLQGKIYKHMGDLVGAMQAVDFAQQLDTADRMLNSKCAKYMLRAGHAAEAEDLVRRYAKPGETITSYMHVMQVVWYALELAAYHRNAGNWGEALKYCHQVEAHFNSFSEEQYEFHTFSLRNGKLGAYVNMVHMLGSLRRHKFYTRAAQIAIDIYLRMIDHPEEFEKKPCGGQSNDEADKELKKQKRKQKKQEAADKSAEENKKSAQSQAKKEDNPELRFLQLDGQTFLNCEDPLKEATKWALDIGDLGAEGSASFLRAFEVFRRLGKPLRMLQCLECAIGMNPSDPKIVAAKEEFTKHYEANKDNMEEHVLEIVQAYVNNV